MPVPTIAEALTTLRAATADAKAQTIRLYQTVNGCAPTGEPCQSDAAACSCHRRATDEGFNGD